VKRREFITLLGGAAVAWPLAARAQQAQRMPRIGVLAGLSEADPDMQARLDAFRRGLHGLGWVESRNIHIDYQADRSAHEHASARIARSGPGQTRLRLTMSAT
jgi:putative tryptophan/tyrosine transport system substrate-binding protein